MSSLVSEKFSVISDVCDTLNDLPVFGIQISKISEQKGVTSELMGVSGGSGCSFSDTIRDRGWAMLRVRLESEEDADLLRD